MSQMVPPPYIGFRQDVVPNAGYPVQPYSAQVPYPVQQYSVPNQPYPGQQYPAPNQSYPGPPPNQPFPGQEYPSAPGGPQVNFGSYGQPPMPPPLHVPAGDASYKPDDLTGWTGFSDKAIRAVFVRKVYLILMVQLTFTLGIISLFVFEPHVKLFVRRNLFLYHISYFIFLGVYIALACCGNLRRKYPTNMIMLSIFTMTMAYMMGTLSSHYDTDAVLMAVGICAAVCLTVSVFSFHTKFDFTSCGGVLFVMLIALMIMGFISIFTYSRIMTTIYAGCGALLFTAFLAYDTQMLMGGKKHELSPEEHIFAAMQIYLDIVYIFMFLLTLLGSGRK